MFSESLSSNPSSEPIVSLSGMPSSNPNASPSLTPSSKPIDKPSISPSNNPSSNPSVSPSIISSTCPVQLLRTPQAGPSSAPSKHQVHRRPCSFRVFHPSDAPSMQPSSVPTSMFNRSLNAPASDCESSKTQSFKMKTVTIQRKHL
jgi:hypothetical protein